ncbi:hypothetical protein GCM10010428_65110 [Actinosynnema pretiosum subsp. pretiosum]
MVFGVVVAGHRLSEAVPIVFGGWFAPRSSVRELPTADRRQWAVPGAVACLLDGARLPARCPLLALRAAPRAPASGRGRVRARPPRSGFCARLRAVRGPIPPHPELRARFPHSVLCVAFPLTRAIDRYREFHAGLPRA